MQGGKQLQKVMFGRIGRSGRSRRRRISHGRAHAWAKRSSRNLTRTSLEKDNPDAKTGIPKRAGVSTADERTFSQISPGVRGGKWSCGKFCRGTNRDFQIPNLLLIGFARRRCQEIIPSLGMGFAEDVEGGAVKRAGVPLALDRIHIVTLSRQHKIHLPSLFVPPVTDRILREVRQQILQNKMFPQQAAIVGTEGFPSARPTHEARVEG